MESSNKNYRHKPASSSERGAALAMLLWFLAAMTLLVASIGYTARADIKLTQLHLAEAKAKAAGDGAMLLMLAEAFTGNGQVAEPYNRLTILLRSYELNGIQVQLELRPLNIRENGLVDIYLGSREQLQKLFEDSADLPSNTAADLAEDIIQWRAEVGEKSIRAIEDLFQVESMNRVIFESIRDAIFVVKKSVGPAFRLDAYVTIDERRFIRRRWVVEAQGNSSGLPWRFIRTEALRVAYQENSEV